MEKCGRSYGFCKGIERKISPKDHMAVYRILWEEIQDLEVLNNLDVLVDGEFIEAQKDISLKWKGSANQRVIDVPRTLEAGKIVLHA